HLVYRRLNSDRMLERLHAHYCVERGIRARDVQHRAASDRHSGRRKRKQLIRDIHAPQVRVWVMLPEPAQEASFTATNIQNSFALSVAKCRDHGDESVVLWFDLVRKAVQVLAEA